MNKKPWEMSESEYLRWTINARIPDTAYQAYRTSAGLDFIKPEHFEEIVAVAIIHRKAVEVRRNREPLRYVQRDSHNEILRDANGMAMIMTLEDMLAAGLPTESADLGAFVGDRPVGFASDEFGATGVWVVEEMQRGGLGLILLRHFHKLNPRLAERPLGQATTAGRALARAYYRWMKKVNQCREEIADCESKLRAGHPDVQGLCLGLHDWFEELRKLTD